MKFLKTLSFLLSLSLIGCMTTSEDIKTSVPEIQQEPELNEATVEVEEVINKQELSRISNSAWFDFVEDSLIFVSRDKSSVGFYKADIVDGHLEIYGNPKFFGIPQQKGPDGEDLFQRKIASSCIGDGYYWLNFESNYKGVDDDGVTVVTMKEILRINPDFTSNNPVQHYYSHETGKGEIAVTEDGIFVSSYPSRIIHLMEGEQNELHVESEIRVSEPLGMASGNNTLYPLSLHNGIYKVSISDSGEMNVEDVLGEPEIYRPWSMTIDNDIAYAVGNPDIFTVSLNNPEGLSLIGKYDAEYRGDTWGMPVKINDFLVVLRKGVKSRGRTLELYNVSDPEVIDLIEIFELEGNSTNYISAIDDSDLILTNDGKTYRIQKQGIAQVPVFSVR